MSRKPIALPDALVYESYGLTKDGIAIVEGRAIRTTRAGSKVRPDARDTQGNRTAGREMEVRT